MKKIFLVTVLMAIVLICGAMHRKNTGSAAVKTKHDKVKVSSAKKELPLLPSIFLLS